MGYLLWQNDAKQSNATNSELSTRGAMVPQPLFFSFVWFLLFVYTFKWIYRILYISNVNDTNGDVVIRRVIYELNFYFYFLFIFLFRFVELSFWFLF